MSLKSYYRRQAQTSRRLATQAINVEQATQLLTAANYYDTRAHEIDQEESPREGWMSSADAERSSRQP